jgi:glycosyltransferase involved in cell wall biosynthesis
MYVFIKNFKNQFYFIPKFFYFCKVFWPTKKKIRPYFGFYIKNSGGPNIRTRRMINFFGNFFVNPNLIYAQSFWSTTELKDAIKYSKKNKIPIIFNQNGVYYKGWHKDNYRKKNMVVSHVQKVSKFIFYQSNFCKKSSFIFNKYKPKNYKILHNAIPFKKNLKNNDKNKPRLFNILISGYFNKQNLYILKPAINVIYKMYKKMKKSPRLVIVGLKKNQLKKFYKKKINFLIDKNKIEIIKNYKIKKISYVLKNIHLALHLKYKDPCPNSVLERMHYGIPHVISQSGGTPELTGNSSINIKVEDTWKSLIQVDERKLYAAIILAIKKYLILKKNTCKQIRRFKWNNYISEHKKIFSKYTNKTLVV